MIEPTILSFYTNDWEYPKHAVRLKSECDFFGLESIIEELPSTGYLQNCQKKPFYIRDKIKEIKKSVLWIDVDGSILKTPEHFLKLDETVDISLKSQILNRPDRKWHVGTVWLNYSEKNLNFLDMWCDVVTSYNSENKLIGDHSDESALNFLLDDNSLNLKIDCMPKEYYYIDMITGFHEDAVIYHRISGGESKREQSRKLGVWL
jgi:hypothetical protein